MVTPPVTVTVDFYCGLTTLANDVDTGIGCEGNVLLGSATHRVNYCDDSQFHCIAEDVVLNLVESLTQEGTTTYGSQKLIYEKHFDP